jgi:hypothetical protein
MPPPPGGNAGQDWTAVEINSVVYDLCNVVLANGNFLMVLPDNEHVLASLNTAAQTVFQSSRTLIMQTIEPIQHRLTNQQKADINEAWQQVAQTYQARFQLNYNAQADLIFRGGRRRRQVNTRKLIKKVGH